MLAPAMGVVRRHSAATDQPPGETDLETEQHAHGRQADAQGDGRLPLPSHTTPTWEIELLLSAGTVFALFQVPGPLHAWSWHANAQLGQAGDMLVSLALAYGLMAVYALIAMFLIHLTARAYWVALVGIDSVYPKGIRWDKFSGGPVARAELQRQVPSFSRLIEQADNIASLCFAFGLVVVMSALLGAAIVMPVVGISILISEYAFDGAHLHTLIFGLTAAVLLPMIAIGVIDKTLGKKLPPGAPPPPGALTTMVTAVQRLPFNRLPAPLIAMLATNQRGYRAYALFFVAMFGMFVLLFTDIMVRRGGGLPFDGYLYLPAEAGAAADPRHYREFPRDAMDAWRAPSVDAMVAQGDWLRLIVPYDPERHGVLFEQRCTRDGADAAALADLLANEASTTARQAAEQRVLDCLFRQLAIHVDGAPLADPDYAFTRDPVTGLRALLVMIPTRNLPAGRHTLQLARAPRESAWDDPEEMQQHQARGPTRIPFWR